MIAAARNDSSNLGLRMNHSSDVGLRNRSSIAPSEQFLMQLPHRLQFAVDSMVLGKLNRGHPATRSVPL